MDGHNVEHRIRVLQGDIPYDEPPEEKSSGIWLWAAFGFGVLIIGLVVVLAI